MDRPTFDVLTRRVARQTTRRAALAALLGGALLLGDPAPSDANDQAKRRKKRKQRQARSATHRGIAILFDNTAGTQAITVSPGALCDGLCCAAAYAFTIPAGGSRKFETHCATGWAFINGRYWFQMTNPLIGRPYLGVALGGRFSAYNVTCCQTHLTGSTVEYRREFAEGASRAYNIQGRIFTVARNRDTRGHKVFTIKLPASI